MRGPYSEYAAPPIYVYPDRPKPGVHFSRTELVQLGVAILALSAAFTILYVRSDLLFFGQNPGLFLAIYFPASLLAVGTGVGLLISSLNVLTTSGSNWLPAQRRSSTSACSLVRVRR